MDAGAVQPGTIVVLGENQPFSSFRKSRFFPWSSKAKRTKQANLSLRSAFGQLKKPVSGSIDLDLLLRLLHCGLLRLRHREHFVLEPCLDRLSIGTRMLLVSRQTAE